jgi:precorrin-3B synthase
MQTTENLCPGIRHAVPAKDGMLIRIRTPGGLISGAQFKAVARAAREFSHPTIDITARANIQLRGIRQEHLESLVETLALAGLIPSTQHDRVRNIATSPLAGLDSEELLDTRPLVRQLDRELINDPALASLPPKFSFLIDGGGRRFDTDTADIGLMAVAISGEVRFHLAIGGTATQLGVHVDQAAECMAEAARACLAISKAYGIPSRAKKIASVPGAFADLLRRLSHLLQSCPGPVNRTDISQIPTGILPGTRPGTVHIVPSIPLGRLTAAQAEIIAEIVLRYEGDLRLASWRGLVLASMPASASEDALHELRAIGLSCDLSDGYAGLAACAGLSGCASALADVRQDAALLARHLADSKAGARAGGKADKGWTVNFSGCDKRCAMRNGATVELVATPSGYSLKIDGEVFRSECSPEAAIDLVVSSLLGEAPQESES